MNKKPHQKNINRPSSRRVASLGRFCHVLFTQEILDFIFDLEHLAVLNKFSLGWEQGGRLHLFDCREPAFVGVVKGKKAQGTNEERLN